MAFGKPFRASAPAADCVIRPGGLRALDDPTDREPDESPVLDLLEPHRARLRRMIALRIDRRIAGRIDASDVVQESMMEAARRLPEYLLAPPVPLYPWLRAMALNRLADQHRRHVTADRRSVRRERPWPTGGDGSAQLLAERLGGPATQPGDRLRREERDRRVAAALELLPDPLREVLALRYLEDLSAEEIAAIVGVTDRTVRRRHREALERLAEILEAAGVGGSDLEH